MPHVTLCIQRAIKTEEIQAYVPTFNLDYKNDNGIKSEIKIAEETKLEQVIKDPFKLTKLSLSEEISNNIKNQGNNIRNKYFMYQ